MYTIKQRLQNLIKYVVKNRVESCYIDILRYDKDKKEFILETIPIYEKALVKRHYKKLWFFYLLVKVEVFNR